MKCNRCHGTGWVSDQKYVTTPCPDCMGSGVEDCCHGHEAQPEKKDDE
jgi:DnaJ-class molecular chaperone